MTAETEKKVLLGSMEPVLCNTELHYSKRKGGKGAELLTGVSLSV